MTQGDNRGSLSRYTVRSLEASGKVVPLVGRPVQFIQNFPTKTSKIPRVNRSSSLPLMCEAVSLVTVHTSILLAREKIRNTGTKKICEQALLIGLFGQRRARDTLGHVAKLNGLFKSESVTSRFLSHSK